MKLHLLFTGKTSDPYLKEGIDIFYKRLAFYLPVSMDIIPISDARDKNKAMEDESKAVQSKLLPGDFLIVLDEKGKEVTSRQLAVLFQKWMLQGIGRIVILTGGPYGISPGLKEKANYILSVSKLTFTHQMIRLILVEQIYRAMTIIKNEGYHHD